MTSAGEHVAAGGADRRRENRCVFLVGITAAAGWLDALALPVRLPASASGYSPEKRASQCVSRVPPIAP
jgi:hypothetical protein